MSTGGAGRPAGGTWPSVADYNDAVQNLHVSMGDAELRAGVATPGPSGVPMPYAGGFADVYRVDCPATGNTWAVKFFKREVRGLRERYQEISQHLRQARLPFMVDFHYLEDGVRIAGRSFPIVKLRWVEGLTLNQFVMQSLDQPRMLDQLLHLWVKVASRLRAARIAHADLQYGNVMLVPRDDQGHLLLKLIDYDGMWVPALAERPSGEAGHRHFQHPRRAADNVYSAEVDRFSHLAICCALRCLSIGGRQLWGRFDNGDNLLFSEADFANPASSALFRELWTLRHPDARALVGRLALATQVPLEHTPQIDELIVDGRVRPLDEAERRAAEALLESASVPRVLPVARPLPVARAATPVTPVDAAVHPVVGPEHSARTVQDVSVPLIVTTSTSQRKPPRPATGLRSWVKAYDDWLARIAGSPSQQQLLRTATVCGLIIVMTLAGLTIRSLTRGKDDDVVAAPSRAARPEPKERAKSTSPALPAIQTIRSPSPTGPPPPLAVAPFDAAEAKQHQHAWAKYLGEQSEREISLPGNEKLTMVLIPAGEFVREEAGKEFHVRLTQPFYLGKYEVTQAQWRAVMGNDPSKFNDDPTSPVDQVSWDDIQPFLAKLNMGGAARAWRFDLPTEAQWEYACRAGTTTIYHFGDDHSLLASYGWFDKNSVGKTHSVGKLEPNPFGLHDVHGNVWEWCADWYESGYYSTAPHDDPRGPFDGSYRVRRGGSWDDDAFRCVTASRNGNAPMERWSSYGFRLALSPSGVPPELAQAKPSPTTPAPPQPEAVATRPDLPPPPPAVAPFGEVEAKQHQLAWAESLGQLVEREIVIPGNEKLTMILIPAGEFVREERRKQFRVRLTQPFYLGKYEVTQAQWQAVMGSNPAFFKDDPTNPVEQISWNDIQPFLTKLNAGESAGPWRFHLPTEAQWEYACRAGTTSLFSFGDSDVDLPQYAWFGSSSGNRPQPVGKLTSNPFGLYDMHGNVWEWCADWHESGYYAKAPQDDPSGPTLGSHRVLRGGSWGYDAANCRAAVRFSSAPSPRSIGNGFRLALSSSAVSPVPGQAQSSSATPAPTPPEAVAKPAATLPPPAVAPFGEVEAKQHQQAWAKSLGQTVEREIVIPGDEKLSMILIPAGEFVREVGRTPFRVRLTQPFYLGKYEVTQAQWQAVMGNNPAKFKDDAQHPVEQVSWDDIQPFLAKLNASGSAGSSRFALPSEAQWEYACRAGATTTFSFGDSEDDFPQYGWGRENEGRKTHTVGELKPNSFGLHDMHGNVWEWCADWYDFGYYSKAPQADPPGPSVGSARVIRGGSMAHDAAACRAAWRPSVNPTNRALNGGFRLALIPSGVLTSPAAPLQK